MGRSTLIHVCAYNNYILGVLSKEGHLSGQSGVSLKWEERDTLISIPLSSLLPSLLCGEEYGWLLSLVPER